MYELFSAFVLHYMCFDTYVWIYFYIPSYTFIYIYIYNCNYTVIGMKPIIYVCQSSSFYDTVHIGTFTM